MTDAVLVIPPVRRRRGRRLVTAVVLLLGVSEGVARFGLGLGDPPLSMIDDRTEYRFVPGVYHRFGKTISYNAFSMRSGPISREKFDAAELRVLVVGDSIINGGAQTDDRELATTLLQDRLATHFGRPVRVCNISAGSWGPPNEAAYLDKFGWFDADALVLVVSSHDGTDAPTFNATVGVAPEFPDHTPPCALWEGLQRYTPLGRWLTTQTGTFPNQPDPPTGPLPERQVRRAMDAIFDKAAALGVPATMVMNWQHDEADAGKLNPPATVLLDAAAAHAVPVLQFGPAQAAALKAGQNPYRDYIHPNVSGQRILADLIEPAVTAAIESRRVHPQPPAATGP